MILYPALGTLPGSKCSINSSCPNSGSVLLLWLPWISLAQQPSKLSLQFQLWLRSWAATPHLQSLFHWAGFSQLVPGWDTACTPGSWVLSTNLFCLFPLVGFEGEGAPSQPGAWVFTVLLACVCTCVRALSPKITPSEVSLHFHPLLIQGHSHLDFSCTERHSTR